MEENFTNDLNYILQIEMLHEELLAGIRHWSNLKIATGEGLYWIKDFTSQQINSVEVKSIPFAKVFYIQDNKLFLLGKSLPERKAPSFLWTPITRGLPIVLPKQNHNYFGMPQKIDLTISPSNKTREPFAILCDFHSLEKSLEAASSIRFQSLDWIILQKSNKVFILGTPLLPIIGETYWRQNNFLIPTGYDFNHATFINTLETRLNSEQDNWIIWTKEGKHFYIPKTSLKKLSLSSFRLTKDLLNHCLDEAK